MTTSDIRIGRAGAVLEIYFNRPQKKNALTAAMYLAMVEAFRQAEEDPEIRIILVAGTRVTTSATS